MSETELNEVNVKQLSDDELYQKLRKLGGPVGPIVQSTRSVYERKLLQLLCGPAGSDTSEHSEQETEIDSSLPVYYPETKVISPPKFQFRNSSISSSSTRNTTSSTDFRYRISLDSPFKNEGVYFDRTNLARSSYRSDLKQAQNKSNIYGGEVKISANKQEPTKKSSTIKIVLIVIFILMILICLIVYNMESNKPIPIPPPKIK